LSVHLQGKISARKPAVKADADVGRGSSFRLTVLHNTACPAALVEMGFISNAQDRAVLVSAAGQLALVAAIEAAVLSYQRDAGPMA
jgi:N-acetylmuramoyl-L-alanine amidase